MPLPCLLQKQHPILKIIITLLLSIYIFIVPPAQLLTLCLILPAYFLLCPGIYRHWLNLQLRLLPFFLTLVILNLLFQQEFYPVLWLLTRITLLLLLSAYLFKTTEISSLSCFLPHRKNLRQFLQATLLFIPLFLESFAQARKHSANPLQIIKNSLEQTYSQMEDIREQLNSPPLSIPVFNLPANLSGIILISLLVFLQVAKG